MNAHNDTIEWGSTDRYLWANTMIDAQSHSIYAKNPPLDVVYFKNVNKLVVSNTVNYTDSHYNKAILLVLEPGAPTPYGADYMFASELQNVTSMDKSKDQYLICINGVHYFVKDMSVGMNYSSPNCYMYDLFTINAIPTIPYYTNNTPYPIKKIPEYFHYPYYSPSQLKIIEDCTN